MRHQFSRSPNSMCPAQGLLRAPTSTTRGRSLVFLTGRGATAGKLATAGSSGGNRRPDGDLRALPGLPLHAQRREITTGGQFGNPDTQGWAKSGTDSEFAHPYRKANGIRNSVTRAVACPTEPQLRYLRTLRGVTEKRIDSEFGHRRAWVSCVELLDHCPQESKFAIRT
jgi:hypothetical protein